MQVDQATVKRIARLARIKMQDEEIENIRAELTGILDWVEQLNEVDTDAVAPMTCAVPSDMTVREDVVTDGEKVEAVMANAPVREGDYFAVPKVVE